MNLYGSPPPSTYSLTITATAGGTTNPPPETYTYSQGQTVPVQPAPNIGYVFDHWELNGTSIGSTNPVTITMDADYTLDAEFSLIVNRTLTITASTGGTTSPVSGTYIYTNGTVVNVQATPSGDYTFDHWQVDEANVGSTNPITVIMDANHTLYAVFYAVFGAPIFLQGPFYWNGVEYWIVRFEEGRPIRLVSNFPVGSI